VIRKIGAHNGNDQFSFFKRVSQLMLNYRIGNSRYYRQHAVCAIDGLLDRDGPGRRDDRSMLRHVHLNPVRRCQRLQTPSQGHLGRIKAVTEKNSKRHSSPILSCRDIFYSPGSPTKL